MIERMGKPQTNSATKAKKVATPKAVATAFSKGSADEKAAKEAEANNARRDALKAKTDAMLEKKKARMAQQAKMNADIEVLNETSGSLYSP